MNFDDQWTVAVIFVALFSAWRLATMLPALRRFVSKNMWAGALVEFALFPAAAYGIGELAIAALGWFGQNTLQQLTRSAATLLLYLGWAIGTGRLVEVWVLTRDSEETRTRLSKLARFILYGLCAVTAIFLFLVTQGFTSTQFYVGTGAAAAIAIFAMQQTLGDLFSGIALSLERPFRIGEWIRLNDGTEGEVIDTNWRSTHLRGWDNTTFVVPNAVLAQQRFTNLHGKRHLFAPWYYVRISGETDPEVATTLLQEAASKCESVLPFPVPVARLVEGKEQPYTYMVWVHFENYPSMFKGRAELYQEIHRALRDAGTQVSAEIQEIRYRPAKDEEIETEQEDPLGLR